MSDKKVKRIAYVVSDYEKLVLDYSYYVDKTKYLRSIEEAGDYLFFIRPRRFGKTLFLSMMESYYDISKSDQFDVFYKGTQVHRNPTDEKNSYLVLKFNFSAVDPHPKRIEASFLNNVRNTADSFLLKYGNYLAAGDMEKPRDKLENTRSAADILSNVVKLCRDSSRKIHIIIDEYDNFANTILSTSGSAAYENLTHGEGFFRSFFNFLKEGTSGSGAPISRLFITGVSPVTLDDVTSGFNIGKNISIDSGFNEMLGFTGMCASITGNFISLLFYFGLLTIKGVSREDEATILQVPNETVRRLYYDYIKEAYEETEEQLAKYALDEKFQKAAAGTTLIKLVLVFSGTDLKYIGEVGSTFPKKG